MKQNSDLTHAVDLSFRSGLLKSAAPPTHFYMNVTERCSLQCRHCITRAPEKTKDRTARTMGEDVLEAIRPHLRHAQYVGFPHAGEPLLGPALEPMLEALQQLRGGQETTVHLLSNGQGLDSDRFLRLCDLGVNSFSVSVDGMTPSSHDRLRLGSSITKLTARLAELVSLRRTKGLPVRLGIAWTITQTNLSELPMLVKFASRIALDWVKLEEMEPINQAGSEEGAIGIDQLWDSIRDAIRMGEALGLPVLDHVGPHAVWKCRMGQDAAMARFSRLDDFVNRMEINPCRLPWELICVEPNGDVRPLHFEYRVAGNLLKQDLMSIWNGPVFQELRAKSLEDRICKGSKVVCGLDGGPGTWKRPFSRPT